MDTNKLTIVPEQLVADFLTAFKPMSLANVLAVLSRLRSMSAIYAAYRECEPKRVKKLLGEFRDWFEAGLRDPEAVAQKFLSALGDLFPIDESGTDEILFSEYSERGFSGFYPLAIGPCLSWDIVDEMLSDVSHVDGWYSLPLFFGAIGNGFDEDAWKMLAKHFHWPFRQRPSTPKGEWYIDDRKLRKALTKNRMTHFWTAWKVCTQDTGVIFFDVNPNDEMSFPELIEVTPENLSALAYQWRKTGKPMYLKYSKALNEAESNPRVLKKLFELMAKCIVVRKEKEDEHELAENDDD